MTVAFSGANGSLGITGLLGTFEMLAVFGVLNNVLIGWMDCTDECCPEWTF